MEGDELIKNEEKPVKRNNRMRNLNIAVITLMSLAFLIHVSNSSAASPVEVGAEVLHKSGYRRSLGVIS